MGRSVWLMVVLASGTLLSRRRDRGWATTACLGATMGKSSRVESRFVGQAAEWLQLARLDRVPNYAWPDQPECQAFLRKVGFKELTRTKRGWRRRPRQS